MVVAVKQLPKLFGIEAGSGNVWERLYDLLIHLPETHMLTLVVGISSILVMLLIEHYLHRIPAVLVAMVVGIVVSAFFGLSAYGVHVVGEIPAGLAPPEAAQPRAGPVDCLDPRRPGAGIGELCRGHRPSADEPRPRERAWPGPRPAYF